MAAQVHHVGLTVGDLDRSVAWYCTHFDLRELDRAHLDGDRISQQTDLPGTVIDVALLAGSNLVLELLQYRSPGNTRTRQLPSDVGSAHVCIVVDDLAATYEAMRSRGVVFHAAPTQLVGATSMVYVRDPDGIMVELIEPRDALTLEALLSRH